MKKLVGYTIGILGGDERERVMIECLLAEGARVKVLGNPGEKLQTLIEIADTLEDVVEGTDVLIAPMSGTDASGMIKARYTEKAICLDESFFKLVKGKPVLIGMTNDKVKALAKAAGVNLQLMATREDVAILNAIPTAEGAIQIAMEELPITIHGSKSLVMGLGKCGLTLAWRLRALGSTVYGVTRSAEAIAKARDLGIITITYEDLEDYLPDFDLIYNTVPAMVLREEEIKLLGEDTLIIDLASAPGGVDFEAAKAHRIKAMLCLGLPGKVAPRTSGMILGQVVPEIILEIFK